MIRNFLYLGVMKKKTIFEAAGQGSAPQEPPILSLEQIKAALERDFKAMHALLNMVRSEPRILDTMSEVVFQNTQNHQTVKAAREEAKA